MRGPNKHSSLQRCTQKAKGSRAVSCVPFVDAATGPAALYLPTISPLYRAGMRKVTAARSLGLGA